MAMKLFKLIAVFILSILSTNINAQGVGIPKKTWGLGFGNSERFDGLRFNFIDKNIDKINGMSFTVWVQDEM